MSKNNIDKSITYQERNIIYKQRNGYMWEDVQNRKIQTIGYYWQAGLGTGIVGINKIWYIYFGSPHRNDTFYIIAEITEQEYLDLQHKYQKFLYDDENGIFSTSVSSNIVNEIKNYVLNSKIIEETWNLF